MKRCEVVNIWQIKSMWKQRNPQSYAFKPNYYFEGHFKSIFPLEPFIMFALSAILFTFSRSCTKL